MIHLVYAPNGLGENLRAILVGEYHGAKQILEVSENKVDIADALRSLLTEVSARLQNELGDGIAEFIKAATAAQ